MLKYFIAVTLAVPLIIIMAPLGFIMYLKPDWFNFKFRYKFIKILMKWLCIVLRVKHNVIGLENIPKEGTFLITPNHQSFYDAISLIAVSKRPFTYVAKKETKKMPLVGIIVKILGGFFLDRESIRQSLELMKRIEEFMKKHKNIGVVIFPEGTRTKDPDLKPVEFKGGSYKVAYKVEAPVIPATIHGTTKVLSKKWYWIHRVDIIYGKTMNYEDYKTMSSVELANYCQRFADRNIEELNKVNDCRKKTDDK